MARTSTFSPIIVLICFCGMMFSTCGLRAQEKTAAPESPFPLFKVIQADVQAQTVSVINPDTHKESLIAKTKKVGSWTLMAVLQESNGALAVFEDLSDYQGEIVYISKRGVFARLPKTAEPTSAPTGSLYGGRTLEEITRSKRDLLTPELLSGEADPEYHKVAAALPPLRVPAFVGTPYGDEKPTYDYGGFSDEIYVDVGKLYPAIQEARNKHDVWEGLIGGWLPVLRYVFPAAERKYWEETIFADVNPGHFWTQPVWYRVLSVENGELKEAHYFYHHLPFPPRGEPSAAEFYSALLKVRSVWERYLNPAMQIQVPDERIRDFCFRALSLQMITRVNDHPRYGYRPLGGINVFGGYGYNNVDTFQDTFNSDVAAHLEWGLFGTAKRYIDDYFTNSVRDDGSIDTRGPEIGQYGKMLAVVARYYSYTKDAELLRKHHLKLNAIVTLLENLHKESKERPASDISFGIIRGWSEHDSSLKVNPYRFMNPHFANNAMAARGFHDLGTAWIEIARRTANSRLQTDGQRMLAESESLKKDMYTAIEKSVDRHQNPPYLPAVAGDTPTYGKQRAYMEMLESGELTRDEAKIIHDNLAANGNSLFGLPRGGSHLTGFLDFGPAYSRLQSDSAREFLLIYYAHMAHIYSRGTWTSVESAKLDGTLGGPYCTPSQDTIPIFTKWMLAFEEPDEPVLWLARATPRSWLEGGKRIVLTKAPTRFGEVGYELNSDIQSGKVSATLHLPEGYSATTKLRLRVSGGKKIRSVTVNKSQWKDYSADAELVTIPPSFKGNVFVEAAY